MELSRRDYLVDRLGGLQFQISARSFLSSKSAPDRVLYQTALDYAGLTEQRRDRCLLRHRHHQSFCPCRQRDRHQVVGLPLSMRVVTPVSHTERALPRRSGRQVLPRLAADGTRADVIVVDSAQVVISNCRNYGANAARTHRLCRCNPPPARDLAYLSHAGHHVQAAAGGYVPAYGAR